MLWVWVYVSVLHEGICLTVLWCNLLACVYVIHHLWGQQPYFFLFKSQAYLDKTFHFFNRISLFFTHSFYGLELSLQDVALVSRGLKPLRVTPLITSKTQGERCLAGCYVSFCFVLFSLLHSSPPRLSLSIFICLDLLYIYYLSLFTLPFFLRPLFFI